jgi:hypothetical protein
MSECYVSWDVTGHPQITATDLQRDSRWYPDRASAERAIDEWMAQRALSVIDERGKENRVQAAIAWLHAEGSYEGLTCDEERALDATVARVACAHRGDNSVVPPASSK